MDRAQLIAIVIVCSDAVVSYLLAQPDGTLPQPWPLVLGAVGVVLTTVALYARPNLPGAPIVQSPPAE